MGKLHDLPFGYVGTYDANEIEIVSTIKDPPKIRLVVDADKVESNLGCVSFNTRRPDGEHDEHAYVMGRLTADKQGGALYLGVRAPGSQHVREVLYLDSGQAIFRVPIVAPNLMSGAGSDGRFYSGDRRFCWNFQTDGSVVLYATHGSTDETTWTARWALRPTGALERYP